MIPAPRRRTRVTLRRGAQQDDGHGGQVTAWSDAGGIWAEVVSQNGREAVIANSLQGASTFRISTLWRPDIGTDDQLRLPDGRDLNIRSAEDPDGRRRDLVIIADTAGTQG